MEETSTNIHMHLVRRNNFLRENPISCQIVAVFLKMDAWRGFESTKKRNDRARTGAYCVGMRPTLVNIDTADP
jgi:hypothetical protein